METIITPHKEPSFSKTQAILLAVVLAVAAVFFLNRQFGLFDRLFRERVEIPRDIPYAEAVVAGVHEGVIFAERTSALMSAGGLILSKKLEILTDEKTVFAEITSFGPIAIPRTGISEKDIVWVYERVRSFEETLAEPVDPDLAIPFEDAMRDPRERIKADFVVKVGK